MLSAVYRLLYFLYTEGIRSEEDTETAHGTLRDLERMKLCMEFVREHYGERISLADAAGLLAITPEHFCRLFRKYTGQTFLAYVNQIRMEHFHTDLLETDKNITFLLDKNGITNYKGFFAKIQGGLWGIAEGSKEKTAGKKAGMIFPEGSENNKQDSLKVCSACWKLTHYNCALFFTSIS